MKKYFTANGERHYVNVRAELNWISFDKIPIVWGFGSRPEYDLTLPMWVLGIRDGLSGQTVSLVPIEPYCKHWRRSLRRLYPAKGEQS